MDRRTLVLLASMVFAGACTSESAVTTQGPASLAASPSATAAATASATAGATTAPPSPTAEPPTPTASTAPGPTSTVGASDPPTAEPTDGSTGAPADGTTYDQETFTVVLPEGWEGVSSEVGYSERLTELQAEYEEDAQALSSLASLASVLDGGTISFIALDLNEANRTQNFIANMNVIAQDLGGQSLTLEDFVAVNMGAVEAQEGLVGTVEQRPAQLGESEATAVTYTQERGSFQNVTYQFYTVSETHAYVVTFSADTENFDQVQPTFDQIAEGFIVK